ncbi:synaptonemal complex protein 3-like [Nannospalax galili]|uniref:synaptonemal complex protein 3-like n=1 Tax=Nannospalax galili TaxID=1026970 RepID=UPI0004ED0955|nr:synaptonemal complex protein 3-like [Nannospalax galili]
MPPKAVKPQGRPRKCPKVDPAPSEDSQKPCEEIPARNPDTSAEEGPSETQEPMPGPSETLQETELSINATVKNFERKIDQFVRLSVEERQKFYQEYSREFLSLIVMWNMDAEEVKNHREKLASLLEERQNLFQQFQVAQTQKMEEFKELYKQYLKSLDDIENCHRNVVADEIKKQMEILDETVVQENQEETAV